MPKQDNIVVIDEDNMPEDYQQCAECGFDHEYEQREAFEWHESHLNDDDECMTEPIEANILKYAIWAVRNHAEYDIPYKVSKELLELVSKIEDKKRKGPISDVIKYTSKEYPDKLQYVRKVMRIFRSEPCQ